jgi:hypothetical protein
MKKQIGWMMMVVVCFTKANADSLHWGDADAIYPMPYVGTNLMVDGVIYSNVVFTEVTSENVHFRHLTGAGILALNILPKDAQKQCGYQSLPPSPPLTENPYEWKTNDIDGATRYAIQGVAAQGEQLLSLVLTGGEENNRYETKVLPLGRDGDGFDLIAIARHPIFSDPTALKPWLMFVVGAIGKTTRESGLHFSTLIVTDAEIVTKHQGYRISISRRST